MTRRSSARRSTTASTAREANLPAPPFPNLFARWTSELVVDQAEVPVPAAEPDGLDWEVELAAIVGATLTDVTLEQAAAGVFGYTVANDISARGAQLQAATLSTGQWALGKNSEKERGDRLIRPQRRRGRCREPHARDDRRRPGHAIGQHRRHDLPGRGVDRLRVASRHLAARGPHPHRHAPTASASAGTRAST
ncbi:MAG: fumarylacetoacetate hydrolase family protein [Sphingomonas sp.]